MYMYMECKFFYYCLFIFIEPFGPDDNSPNSSDSDQSSTSSMLTSVYMCTSCMICIYYIVGDSPTLSSEKAGTEYIDAKSKIILYFNSIVLCQQLIVDYSVKITYIIFSYILYFSC